MTPDSTYLLFLTFFLLFLCLMRLMGLKMLCLVQIDYAALDALCLLMLLDNMIACAPPESTTLQQEAAMAPGHTFLHTQVRASSHSKPQLLKVA